MINSFETRRNITASFDKAAMICVSCSMKPDHRILSRISQKTTNADYSSPAVFVLSDQSFPAYLPTGGVGECLHILRLEDGSLSDLTNILLETLKLLTIPAGSVILIHSLSRLAWVGPAAYIEDLVRARQRICGVYRSGIYVLHGLPLLAEGCSDSNLANDLAAVAKWLVLVKSISE